MVNKSFIDKLHHPELLDSRSMSELEIILLEYPHFQSAHLLFIKNLHNQGSIAFDRELKKTALWVTDRRKLFYLLDDRVLLPVDEDEKIEALEKDNLDIIDFSRLSHATELAEEYIEEQEAESEAAKELDSIILSGSASLGSFFEVEDKVDLEDFKNTFSKPKEQKDKAPEKIISKKDKLIDTFIKEKPKIVPRDPEYNKNEDFSEKSIKESSDLMTDTLAQIYIKQGLYDKAILTYEKLSLKYPEKKVYFAGQIQKIKLISNNK